jgi:hypothetical protein
MRRFWAGQADASQRHTGLRVGLRVKTAISHSNACGHPACATV